DVGRALDAHRTDLARARVKTWLEVFGFHRLLIEIRTWLEQGDRGRVSRALRLADDIGLRAVATNGARALTPADAFLGDILDGMRREGKVQRLLDAELEMCARLGFAGYFLTVADITTRIKAKGIRSACRGSAAGSLICYLTEISEVDPVEHDLVFERFMNPYR